MTLSSILQKSWVTIEQVYKHGKLCSERHLQAELFHVLQSDLNFTRKYQLFVEPNIYSTSDKFKSAKIHGIIPDIIIADGNNIACIMELKYCPTGYIPFEKDLDTFSKFHEHKGHSDNIFLTTNPLTGDYNYDIKYSISKNLILAYGIIANEYSYAITNPADIWTDKRFVNLPLTNYLYLIGSVNNMTDSKFYTIDKTH
jgi:hypothetical protein